jgi:hypothetical protein
MEMMYLMGVKPQDKLLKKKSRALRFFFFALSADNQIMRSLHPEDPLGFGGKAVFQRHIGVKRFKSLDSPTDFFKLFLAERLLRVVSA